MIFCLCEGSHIFFLTAAATEISKINLTPLNEKNYPTKKIHVWIHLMIIRFVWDSRRTWSSSIPSLSTGNAAATRKYSNWRDKTLATIVLTIDPKLLYLIGKPSDPTGVWTKLYSMKLKTVESLQWHRKTFIEIFGELAIIGQPVLDEDKSHKLISFTTVTALEAYDAVPSQEAVTERLLHNECKMIQMMVKPVFYSNLHKK